MYNFTNILKNKTTIFVCVIFLAVITNIGYAQEKDDSQGIDAATVSLPTKDNNDLRIPRMTANGKFRVSITPGIDPVPINRIHSWALRVETASGESVQDADIVINGGMPAHNHGMPTVPIVSKGIGDGYYVIKGMKFQMPGHWTVTMKITDHAVSDIVLYDLTL
tara:strand:- start:49318 stop:49809 length:492 start_codon:yes stop_codon:yes gene_type:complete